jgi:hypothetical protein
MQHNGLGYEKVYKLKYHEPTITSADAERYAGHLFRQALGQGDLKKP